MTILRKIAPNWMKKLEKVEFNKFELKDIYRRILNGNPECCLIGEIHCYNSDYFHHGDGYCDECRDLSMKIPFYFTREISLDNKAEILVRIAQHIKTSHPDILAKK